MADVILTLKCTLDDLAELIKLIHDNGFTEIDSIGMAAEKSIALETLPLPWKRRTPAKIPVLKPKGDALTLVVGFIEEVPIGATFTLHEVRRRFKDNGYSIHSASARLSECCQAGAIELTAQATYTVRSFLTADEIKQKRKKY